MEQPLIGQVALVTGAGTGIGEAIVRSLSGAGATVVLCGRRKEPLQAVGDSLPNPHLVVTCDVRDNSEVSAVVSDVVAKFGRIDLLVNNAGIYHPTPFDDLEVELWDDVIATNLRGAFLFCKAVWPQLKANKGQIVNISSISGTKGFSGSSAYCASKFGLNGLTEVLKIEGQPHGIRAFSLCPGAVSTAIWEVRADSATLDRMMTPEMIADVLKFLVLSPRGIDVSPVVVTNFNDPWAG